MRQCQRVCTDVMASVVATGLMKDVDPTTFVKVVGSVFYSNSWQLLSHMGVLCHGCAVTCPSKHRSKAASMLSPSMRPS